MHKLYFSCTAVSAVITNKNTRHQMHPLYLPQQNLAFLQFSHTLATITKTLTTYERKVTHIQSVSNSV